MKILGLVLDTLDQILWGQGQPPVFPQPFPESLMFAAENHGHR